MLSDRFMISDEQWPLIEPHYLGKKSDPGRSGSDARIFIESVLWAVSEETDLNRAGWFRSVWG
jgi:hypothetical protein